MYNYKLIDKIELIQNSKIKIFYDSGYTRVLSNKPLYYYIKINNLTE